MPSDVKARLLNDLDAAREELWLEVDALAADDEIYPGWTKREFFAHIAGWEAAVFEIFRDYLAGVPVKTYPYSNLDDANERFVGARASASIEDAQLECEINRFAIKTLLADVTDAQLASAVPFPWGTETIEEWLVGAINHERSHLADIRQLRAERRRE